MDELRLVQLMQVCPGDSREQIRAAPALENDRLLLVSAAWERAQAKRRADAEDKQAKKRRWFGR